MLDNMCRLHFSPCCAGGTRISCLVKKIVDRWIQLSRTDVLAHPAGEVPTLTFIENLARLFLGEAVRPSRVRRLTAFFSFGIVLSEWTAWVRGQRWLLLAMSR